MQRVSLRSTEAIYPVRNSVSQYTFLTYKVHRFERHNILVLFQFVLLVPYGSLIPKREWCVLYFTSNPGDREQMGPRLSSLRQRRKRSRDSTPCAPSPEQVAQAMALKDLGNEQFKAGKFKEAEQLYSQALRSPQSCHEVLALTLCL